MDLTKRVLDAQKKGSNDLKNDIIYELKEEAFKVAQVHCKKYGREATDEEKLEALHALNEAIDNYKQGKNTNFLTFAGRVIMRRLVDFFRKEIQVKKCISYDNTNIAMISDMKEIADFEHKQRAEDVSYQRREELLKFREIMGNLGYTWLDIIQNRPKHRDSIVRLQRLALYIVSKKLGKRYLLENPCSRELKKMLGEGIDRRALTKYRPYLCALIVTYINDFPIMQNYLDSFRKEVKNYERSQRNSS